ncbi:ABC transporter substrate-binding protein [Neobacillus niacini]|uniref:ABC transporter substrate-binding protein n=1 Tax=Neobacillus niacini TaxID=86668 RepID=UPI002FFD7CA0
MQRRLIIVLLVCALTSIFALVGCSNTTKDSSGDEKQVTLTVWGDQENQSKAEPAFNKINKLFMEKHPNIKIDYQYSGTHQTIDTAVRSNSLPDLFYVQGNKTPMMELYVNSGALLPLDDYNLDVSRYSEEAISYATVGDSLYSSLPAFMDSQLIYYNKDIFKKYGISEPKTFEEFIGIFDSLKENGVKPMSMPGKDEWGRPWLAFSLASALANDSLTNLANGEGDFSDPNMVKTFQTIHDFANNDYFSKNFITTDTSGAQLSFTNGDVAMMADGTWNHPTYTSTMSNLGSFYIPGIDGEKVAPLSLSNYTTYAVSAKTEHPKEAVEYLKFLSSKEAQQIAAEEIVGVIPTLDDITPSEDVIELTKYDSFGHNILTVLSDVSTDKVALNDIFMREVIPGLLTNELSGDEAAKLLNDALAKTK